MNGGTQGFVAVPDLSAGVDAAGAGGRSMITEAQPNPFRSATNVAFNLSEKGATGEVRLEIFDPSGRRVATVLDQRLTPGRHSIGWDGRAEGRRHLRPVSRRTTCVICTLSLAAP